MTAIEPKGSTNLKRELGLFSAVGFIISVTIGSGIFISPTSVFQYSKSVGMCLVVWLLSGVISLLGALNYAELSTLVPRSGSDYVYYMKAFNESHRFWARLPSFLYSVIMIVVIRPGATAVVLLTFAEYFCDPILDAICVDDASVIERVKVATALLALGIITFINATSVKIYVLIQNVFVCFKVISCLIVVGGGIYQISIGNVENLTGFEGTTTSPKDIALAIYSGLWAFDGWAMVTSVTEEIRKPEVNILRSILISVPLVTVLYVFMNASYMAALTMDEMTSSTAVAVAFGQRILGSFAIVMPISVALSTFSCALSLQFVITRICYVSGQDGLMVKCLSYVHYKKFTPAPAVIFQGMITFIFILTRDIVQLIQFLSFLKLMFYILSMVSLLILKKKLNHIKRVYEVPVILPIFMILIFLFLALTPIIMEPSVKYIVALSIVFGAIFIYYFLIYKNLQPTKILSYFNDYVQFLLEVVPSKSMDKMEDEDVTKAT